MSWNATPEMRSLSRVFLRGRVPGGRRQAQGGRPDGQVPAGLILLPEPLPQGYRRGYAAFFSKRLSLPPAPACHAASKAFRKKFWEEYSAFVADFREAAKKLKKGEWPVRFPLGSFPPGLPFVSAYAAQPP